MQTTSELWKKTFANLNHTGELRVVIGGVEYGADSLKEAKATRFLFDEAPGVGNACAAMLDLTIVPKGTIPRAAKVVAEYRLVLNGRPTEWMPKGTYWINTRGTSGRYVTLECCDAMLKAEQTFLTESTTDNWPKAATAVAAEIATRMGTPLDAATTELVKARNYNVGLPVNDYTMRDVLCHMAAQMGGNWCVTEDGHLQLVPLAGGTVNAGAVGGRPDMGTVQTVTGLRLWQDDNSAIEKGTDTGLLLEADQPDATDALTTTALGYVKGLNYQPYSSTQRHIDPAAELGDLVDIGPHKRLLICALTETIGKSYYADVSAPEQAVEAEQEFPYLTKTERTAKRIASCPTRSEMQSEIIKNNESIELRITKIDTRCGNLKDDYTELNKNYTSLKTSYNEISAVMVRDGAVRSKFALDTSSCTISAGTVTFKGNTLIVDSTNFKVSAAGDVTITGTFESKSDESRVWTINGCMNFYRKVSGRWVQGGSLQALGSNASCGRLDLYGPSASGATTKQSNIEMMGDWGGGKINCYAANGKKIFEFFPGDYGNGQFRLFKGDGTILAEAYQQSDGKARMKVAGTIECEKVLRNGTYL